MRDRRSIRLRDYDYTQAGAYFVTLCAKDRQCVFGEILHDEMVLGELGRTAEEELLKTPELRDDVLLDEYAIMPNHVHAILVTVGLDKGVFGNSSARKPRSLGSIIAGFKSAVTRQCRELTGDPALEIWQRNYYDHVVRSEMDMERIREYIAFNPARWADDEENPANSKR